MKDAELNASQREARLLVALRNNPELMERFESIVSLTEAEVDGRIRTADEVEDLLIEETRKLGHETLEAWAGKVQKSVAKQVMQESPTAQKREKKR